MNSMDYSMSIDADIFQETVQEPEVEENEQESTQQAAQQDAQQDASKVKKKSGIPINRKKRSLDWSLFQELPKGEDNKKRAKCRKCGIVYISESTYGTGNMLTHMKSCLKSKPSDIGQLIMSQTKGSMSLKSPKFDNEVFQELLIEAIIKHNLPFNFVECDGIRAVFKYICEEIKLPSRNTAKAGVLKMFKREKTKLQSLLSSAPGRICLTSDLWSSVATDGYLTLTAHFVDSHWKLNKKILNFCLMPPPHTGVALLEKIYTLLSEWNIEEKLFSVTLDNASSNGCFVEILKSQLNLKGVLLMNGEFFHIRCCAHILNLIVQDGLKEIDEAVVKVRESVKYIKGSPQRKHKFYSCVSQVSLECKRGLRQDVPTRWNSTYLMLENAIFYRRAFIHLQLSDSNYKHCPSQEEWDRAEKICKFWGLFYEVTCLFFGTKYPTTNLFFPQVFIIQHNLKEAMDGLDSFLHRMGVQMNLKFEKYWSEYSVILAVAVMLDPRYKIQFVEWAYSKLHGSGSQEFKRVHDTIFNLFDVYSVNFSHLMSSSNPTRDTHLPVNERGDSLFQDFDNRYKEGISSDKKNELHKYFEEDLSVRKKELDILAWWKGEQNRYPILSNMARDVLSIPISTIASESAFSIGGRVLDQYRSSLLPETVQALLCTRDWIFGKNAIGKEEEETNVDQLTEDIFNLHISYQASKSAQCTSSANTISIDE